MYQFQRDSSFKTPYYSSESSISMTSSIGSCVSFSRLSFENLNLTRSQSSPDNSNSSLKPHPSSDSSWQAIQTSGVQAEGGTGAEGLQAGEADRERRHQGWCTCAGWVKEKAATLSLFSCELGEEGGAFLSAALAGMQAEGVALTSVPKIKFVMLISGGKFGGSMFSSPKLAQNAFSSPLECSSLHFLGEKDFGKQNGIEILDSFVDPFVLHHSEGHVVPKLDEKGSEIMLKFIEKVATTCPPLAPS